MSRSPVLELGALVIGLWPCLALAQDGQGSNSTPSEAAPAASAPPSEPPQPLEVRILGDRADALQKVPGSGTLVGRKDIERTQPDNVAEMLRRVPGVDARQEEGGGLRLDIGVRGLDPGRSRRVLVLEDGVPIALNPYAEPDLYYAPPIERMRAIEVRKGSGSILFGPQTVGGVINFLTIAPPSSREAAIEVDGGERSYFKTLARYGDRFERVRYVAQLLHAQGDGFRREAFSSNDAFAKVAFETSERGELTLKVGVHGDSTLSDDVGLTRAMYEAEPGRPTLAPHDHLDLARYEVSLVHEQQIAADTKLRTLAYAYQTGRIWRRQDYDREPQPGVWYERIVGDTRLPDGAIYFRFTDTILDRTYDVAGIEPRLEHRFNAGGSAHTLETGARLLVERAHYEQRAGETPQSESGALELDERHRTMAIAAYAQDRIAFRDDLLVTPGVRIEHSVFRREIDRELVGASAEDVDVKGDSQSTGVVPGIGMVVGSPMFHVFAGLHVGYAPPRITSAISPKGQDQELEPEESLNYELGARARPVRWLRAETTAYMSNFSNQVVPATNPGALGTELVNGGRTRHIGLETALSLAVGEAAHLGMAVDLSGTFTVSRAVFVGGPQDGHLLPYAPEQVASAVLDLDHPAGPGAQVAWRYVGAQFADDDNTLDVDATGRVGLIPAHHELDALARYRSAATGLTVFVKVTSILDEVYVTARRPEGIATGGFRETIVGLRGDFH